MLTLLVPMAGRGHRFVQAGFTTPKPFIRVNGIPMIERVLNNCPKIDKIRLGVLSEHADHVSAFLSNVATRPVSWPCPEVKLLNFVTAGAASTVLHLLEGVPNDSELLVANADQWLDWSPEHFLRYVRSRHADGAIPIFRASSPKWSFVDMDEDGRIHRVVEKEAISNDATCGIYYWRTAGACRESINQMIRKGLMTNNEYYLAPSYNEMIEQGGKILGYPVPRLVGMGTPEDLAIAEASGISFDDFDSGEE